MRCFLLVLTAALLLLPASANGQGATFLNRKLSDWLNDLEKGSKPATRRSAAFALGRMGSIAGLAIPDLARAVRNDRDARVRDVAANAIGDIMVTVKYPAPARWDEAGKTLQDALLNDSDASVRRSAAYALGSFGKQAGPAVTALKKALRDKNPTVRQNAAWALGRIGTTVDVATVADLCDLLADPNSLVRRDTATALCSLGKTASRTAIKSAGKPLLDMAKNEKDDVVRNAALQALASVAGPEHADWAGDLYPLLEHKDEELARNAAYALGNMGGEPAKRALPVLRKALRNVDPQVQAVAAAALSNAGPAAAPAVDDLALVLTECKEPVVREMVAIALAHIGPASKPAVPALAAALKPVADAPADPDRKRAYERVREAAAEALAQIKFPANEAAIPAIRDAIAKDPNRDVRQRCVWAVFHLRDLETHGMDKVLEAVLEEKDDESLLVRYDSARVLAKYLGAKAPDRTTTVLLHMMTNEHLKVFNKTDARGEGSSEASRGGTETALDLGGDARYMGAEALGWLGKKSADNPTVVAALRKAAKDKEPNLKEKASEALKKLDLSE